jgi:hypothetical protein
MNADEAKKHLTDMLTGLTAGSVLHLLAEVLREAAAAGDLDAEAAEGLRDAVGTLFVVGLGLDAVRHGRR